MSTSSSSVVASNLNQNEWVNWIEEALAKNFIKYYEFQNFVGFQEIGTGRFGKVFFASWKGSNTRFFALKSFFDLNNLVVREIVEELKRQREVDNYENIIRLCGVTTSGSEQELPSYNPKRIILVMEYADSGTLRNYLKDNFNSLTWFNKWSLATQLINAVSCLHDEGIVHRDLHSNSIMVHRNVLKLADFGLSKRIEESFNNGVIRSFCSIPYIDPKAFIRTRENNQVQIYNLNEKSDVYSVGILLWEISSCRPPFFNEPYDIGLAMGIVNGLREETIPNTPQDYEKIYKECWDEEPNKRPNIAQVVVRMRSISVSRDVSMTTISPDVSYNVTPAPETTITQVSEVHNYQENLKILIEIDNDSNVNYVKQRILSYINDNNIALNVLFNWLLNNEEDTNSIMLLGIFYHHGIGTNVDEGKAFSLYQRAAIGGNVYATNNLGLCYQNGIGTSVDEKKAFESYQLAAKDLKVASGIFNLGYCYENGIGTTINKPKAFELYEKVARIGDATGLSSLGCCYQEGIGTSIDLRKAFELYQKSAEMDDTTGLNNLALCYQKGIGTKINKQEAFKIYQKAADMGNKTSQFNLAYMYQYGDGVEEDQEKAAFWYKKSGE